MAMVNLLNKAVLTPSSGEGVTGNGIFRLYESPVITNQNRNSLEVTIDYGDPIPDPMVGGTNFRLTAWLETLDDSGNAYVFHNQFETYVARQQGNVHRMIMEPGLFVLDEGVVVDMWNGQEVIARESKKGGVTPDNFRVVIALIENGFGTSGAFQSIEVSASYRIY